MTSCPSVDVIIPVYRGLDETRRCIESVLNSELAPNVEIIVVNDASPDQAVSNYCNQLSGRIRLITNDINLGFVGSVNRAMKLNPDHDVLLLNSDCEVAGNWLLRMQECAYAEPYVATVTPFSNNATICSYPVINQPNPLIEGWSLQDLDRIFSSVNASKYHTIPTAVGSCMYIRRECLDQVGMFDEERFGLGYGEENDFSLRAARAGWQNLLCASVFVYHQGGVSFGDSKASQMEKADQVMAELYPEYEQLVEDFLFSDPLREFRDAVSEARLSKDAREAGRIIYEQRSYRDSLLKINQVYIERTRDLKASLNECWEVISSDRESFRKTDAALREAQQLAIENLKKFQTIQNELDAFRHESGVTIARKNYEIDLLREEFNSSLQERDRIIINLESQLNDMLNSRSWRYTKWLRWLSSIRAKKL